MVIGLLKEPSFETRAAFLPEHIVALKKMNVQILVESGAGIHAFATDEKYSEAGASIKNRNEILQQSDLIVAINPLSDADMQSLNSKVLIGQFQALSNGSMIHSMASKNCTVFSMDMLPRTTRAQSMDVLKIGRAHV